MFAKKCRRQMRNKHGMERNDRRMHYKKYRLTRNKDGKDGNKEGME